jgi:NADH/NAD ratio-sensing transcriptional regulator Rex
MYITVSEGVKVEFVDFKVDLTTVICFLESFKKSNCSPSNLEILSV